MGLLKTLIPESVLDLGQISDSLIPGSNHTVSQIYIIVQVARGTLKVIWANLLLRARYASKLDLVLRAFFS